ncbi:MAG: class I SAM-dependent rRNA methyltransferase [Planctomycetes bacterium]|nr:class I SAM-dependent rRNA methyltransferase [Planctomycetota bacterium]
MAKVILKARKARPFWFGHPWVFSGAIDRVRGQVADGDVVELMDDAGRLIGEGFWNSKSQISVRLVALKGEGTLDAALLLKRLDLALSMREDVLRLPEVANSFRLVHSEGDGIPGLIVDKVGKVLVLQLSCFGLTRFLEPIVQRLVERCAPVAIVERESRTATEEEGMTRTGGVLYGSLPPGPMEVTEYGVTWLCDPMEGQKTGWYSDQRENRRLMAPFARGREVLDAFSYVGGFGLRMALEGATHVTCVDSSEPALELGRIAAEKAGVQEQMTFEKANVLRMLDHCHQEKRSFDVIVLDPPKFVHRRGDIERGLALYHETNAKAFRVLRDGGVLFTHSCSQHVPDSSFDEMVAAAAKSVGVRAQEFFRGSQAPDHPVMLPLEESRYLKARGLRIQHSGMDTEIAPRIPQSQPSAE